MSYRTKHRLAAATRCHVRRAAGRPVDPSNRTRKRRHRGVWCPLCGAHRSRRGLKMHILFAHVGGYR